MYMSMRTVCLQFHLTGLVVTKELFKRYLNLNISIFKLNLRSAVYKEKHEKQDNIEHERERT